jgi:ATP-dependent RNA helicase DeaD
MEKFAKLGLSKELLKAIEEARFTEPSEIQEKAIPLALAGKDIIGGSATGSGKTLAFGASIIQGVEKGKGVQALILTPTRELAEQVAGSLDKFSAFKDLCIAAVYGGVGFEPQVERMKYSEVVVGTPGRILDHLGKRTLMLNKVRFLVLDEADRMLDMGFIDDVTEIIEHCPKQRQTMLFSATIGPDIAHLAGKYLKNPVEVAVESYVDPSLLEQVYYDVPQNMKFSLLVHLLKNEKGGLVMVFCNTRHNTDFVARNLMRYGIDSMAIHGGLSQNKRTDVLERFNSSKVYVLVCTDVAARGLDIKGVSHVYNYDAPKTSEEYVHRIGRTARAGKEGKAITIIGQRDYENFRKVIKNPDISIKQEEVPEMEEIRVDFRGSDDRGGGRGYGRGGGYSRGGGGRSYGNRSYHGQGSAGHSHSSHSEGRGRFGSRRFGTNRGHDSRGERRNYHSSSRGNYHSRR